MNCLGFVISFFLHPHPQKIKNTCLNIGINAILTIHKLCFVLDIHENPALYIKSQQRINVNTKFYQGIGEGVFFQSSLLPLVFLLNFTIFSFYNLYRYPWPRQKSNVATPESLLLYIIKNKLSIVSLCFMSCFHTNHPQIFKNDVSTTCSKCFKYHDFQFYHGIDLQDGQALKGHFLMPRISLDSYVPCCMVNLNIYVQSKTNK